MKKIEISLIFALVFTLFFGGIGAFSADCETIRSETLRLHILANSDREEDQALKLQVRDRILESMEQTIEVPDSLSEAKESARKNLDKIKQIASEEVKRCGFNYKVDAEIVNMYFTTRQYEHFTLPAGMYDAVRVTIGEAKGKNWWCVLYPPLCIPAAQSDLIIDHTYGEKEQAIVTSDPKYEVRFAFIEWLESVKCFFGWN